MSAACCWIYTHIYYFFIVFPLYTLPSRHIFFSVYWKHNSRLRSLALSACPSPAWRAQLWLETVQQISLALSSGLLLLFHYGCQSQYQPHPQSVGSCRFSPCCQFRSRFCARQRCHGLPRQLRQLDETNTYNDWLETTKMKRPNPRHGPTVMELCETMFHVNGNCNCNNFSLSLKDYRIYYTLLSCFSCSQRFPGVNMNVLKMPTYTVYSLFKRFWWNSAWARTRLLITN